MFAQGEMYRRRELHERYGGQRRGGISTPAAYPLVLIFTGESGRQYGYEDGWTHDGLGIFEYTGEGQRGDMRMDKGNAAILNHAENGEDIHLFKIEGTGVRYEGQMLCAGYETRTAPDIDGNEREAIVFHLVPVSAAEAQPVADGDGEDEPDDAPWTTPLSALRERVFGLSMVTRASKTEAKRNVYVRSSSLRVYVLRRADGVCESCGANAPFVTAEGRPYLEPHHIRRLSDGGPDHPLFVGGVCPNCHKRAHYGDDAEAVNRQLADEIRWAEGRLTSEVKTSQAATVKIVVEGFLSVSEVEELASQMKEVTPQLNVQVEKPVIYYQGFPPDILDLFLSQQAAQGAIYGAILGLAVHWARNRIRRGRSKRGARITLYGPDGKVLKSIFMKDAQTEPEDITEHKRKIEATIRNPTEGSQEGDS